MKKIIGDDEILNTITEIITPFIFVLGIYIILNGHISPGGGFSGGTVLGAGLILYGEAFNIHEIRKLFDFNIFTKAISFSLLFYGCAKGYSFITGAANIDSNIPLGTPWENSQWWTYTAIKYSHRNNSSLYYIWSLRLVL